MFNKSVPEPFVPGDYSCLIDRLVIRSQRDATSKELGSYYKDQHFFVFEVYPEEGGIVWGRVSSSTDQGYGRYIGMRVGPNKKVTLERAYEEGSLLSILTRIAEGIEDLGRLLDNLPHK